MLRTNRMLFTLFRSAAALVTLLALQGCIGHQIYRDFDCVEKPITASPCFESAEDTRAGYALAFIEFDDQGHLWNRDQMHKVDYQIKQQARDSDVLMVVFIHGWKHSAKAEPEDTNIQSFRRSLEKVSADESRIARALNTEPRKVIGIYLGWRGGSVRTPLIKEATFWDRKNTAHKVGQGGVGEVLARLNQIRSEKLKSAIEAGETGRTRLVVIGHSFGGAVVYSAVSTILEQGFLASPDSDVPTIGFGDLVVLLNPAFEAIRYSALSDMSTERESYATDQIPLLAVLTSSADNATGIAFPIGRGLSTLFEKARIYERLNGTTQKVEKINESSANRNTLVHFDSYTTHTLKDLNYKDSGKIAGDCDNFIQESGTAANSLDSNLSVLEYVQKAQDWYDDKPGSQIAFGDTLLARTNDSAGRNPYLVIRVSENLIGGHNEICNPKIWGFLATLIQISTQGQDSQQIKSLYKAMFN